LPRGILHAKVSLLLWSRCARMIVASANLTDDGYRRNHEVFGVLDYVEGSEGPLAPLDEIIGLLLDAVRYADPAARSASAAVRRWNVFLGHISRVTRDRGTAESPPTIAKPRSFAVVTGPGRPSALDTLRDLRFERVDNLGAYRIPSETGLLIPSDYINNAALSP
jgi:hypothetical protein